MKMPVLMLSAALVLAGCGGDAAEAEPEVLSPIQVLPNIALPEGGQVVGTEGGVDAAVLVLSTPLPGDSIVEFYRTILSDAPYRLVNEDVTGSVTSFYVEQDGPPLWVTVEALEAGGTLVRLAGAAVKPDTAAAPAAAAASGS